jgi:hypothetical protein
MNDMMPSTVKRAITLFWLAPVILAAAVIVARLSGGINTGSAVTSAIGILLLYLPFPWLLRRRINFVRLFTIAAGGGCMLALVFTAFVVGTLDKEAVTADTTSTALLICAIVGGFAAASMLLVGKSSSDWFLNGAAPEKRDHKFWLRRAGAGLLAAIFLYGVGLLLNALAGNVKAVYLSGLADSSGTVILEPVHRELEVGSKPESIMACSTKGCGFIDRAGRYVIEPRFEVARPFDASGLACVKLNDKWGCIDHTGNFVIPPVYDHILSPKDSTPIAVKKDGKWGYIDATGKYVVEPKYSGASPFQNGLASVMVGSKWGYINQEGKLVIEPRYETGYMFSASGLAMVRVGSNGKWGYIDATGKYAIEPIYSRAGSLDGGLAFASVGGKSGKIGYIDHTGQWVIKPQFDAAGVFGSADWAGVRVGDKWGFIDRTGRFAIEPKFSWAKSSGFSDGKGLVVVSDGKGTGVIDSTGRYVIQPTYELIQIVPGADDSMLIVVTVVKWCLFETVCLP